MRIHSDILTVHDITMTLADTIPGAWCDQLTRHASRTHRNGFEVRLRAPEGRDAHGKLRRPPQGGAAPGVKAPTYDEWGTFLATLFEQDPDGTFGPYKGRPHFHQTTRYRYDAVVSA